MKSDELHIPKDCMTMIQSNNGIEGKVKALVEWPTCNKNEIDIQKMLIRKLSDSFAEKNGAPYLCWASDGDPTRTQIFDSLVRTKLPSTSAIYAIISKLRLIDMKVGEREETVDYDAKHLAKRFRNYLIGNNIMIGNSRLYPGDIKNILEASPYTPRNCVNELMSPKDKQNVSLATEFLIMFRDAVLYGDFELANFRIKNLLPALTELCHVIDGVLSIYSYMDYSIEDQLKAISKASHTLLFLYRKYVKVIPNVLYHDLQGTFQNVFYCAAKYKVYHPHSPLFLMLLGTDVLERLFGNMRMKLKSGFDNLDIIFCSRAMEEVDRIMESHPSWVSSKAGKVMRRLALDYSKSTNWNVDKLCLNDVDIELAWKYGLRYVEGSKLFEKEKDIVDLVKDKVTMSRPKGKTKVGVRSLMDVNDNNDGDGSVDDSESESEDDQDDSEFDEPMETDDVNENDDVQIETPEPVSIIDYIQEPTKSHDAQIQVDGSWYFKASVVRQLFNGTSASNDRLKRVVGLSKYHDQTSTQNIENVIMQNDPILFNANMSLCLIQKLLVGGKDTKYIDGDSLQDKNVNLVLRKLKLVPDGEYWFATGETSGNDIKATGEKCRMIQPEIVNGKLAFSKSLVIDLAITADLQQGSSSSRSSNSSSSSGSGQNKQNKDKEKRPCKHCKKDVMMHRMRTRVGKHILKGEIPPDCNICGWCGSTQCYPTTLKRTTKTKGLWHYKPISKCDYQHFHARKPAKSNKDNPCTNWVESCPVCKSEIWKYNLPSHYAEKHKDHKAYKISDEELKFMGV